MADPHTDPPEPRVIPVTSEFLVSWDVPEDEHMPWHLDPMHFPDPLPRWENELWCEMANRGMSPAFAGYEMPIRAKGKIFNDYNYAAMFPVVPPEEMEAQGKKAEAALGAAKVVRSLAEAEKLQHGDILVTGTTSPPWTPLFATAAAIVTDTGGILSHCAVVAREYRIPAVVGTGAATKLISDGQVLEVDGDNGTVRIVG